MLKGQAYREKLRGVTTKSGGIWLQPLISGFISLTSATVGEPTCLRQMALSFRFTSSMASGLGFISSL